MQCEFTGCKKGDVCKNCGFVLPVSLSGTPKRNCPSCCIHIGPPRQNKEGATIKVKCGCNGKEAEQFHVAHECGYKNTKGKRTHPRCLPTLIPAKLEDWKERPESSMYHLCFNCEDRTTGE